MRFIRHCNDENYVLYDVKVNLFNVLVISLKVKKLVDVELLVYNLFYMFAI